MDASKQMKVTAGPASSVREALQYKVAGCCTTYVIPYAGK